MQAGRALPPAKHGAATKAFTKLNNGEKLYTVLTHMYIALFLLVVCK